MSTRNRPAHICGQCGGVNDDALARIRALEDQVQLLGEDVVNAERELRGKRAAIKRLKADQDAALRQDPLYDIAERVLHHWQRVCAPDAREATNRARLENCLARLRGQRSEAELKRACDGYALKPYVVNGGRRHHEGPRDDWRADAELIFRSDRHVMGGIAIADQADQLRTAMTPARADESANVGTQSLSEIGEGALHMARFGFYVFPVEQGGKRPVTPNGLLDAKRDENAIRACWSKRPHLNVAVRTGRESGIIVLDVDGDEGWESLHRLEDKHEPLPITASVITPRGGQHFYFRHPGYEVRNTAGVPAPFLDVRGDGGYVLAPPSIGPGGRPYELDEEASIAPPPDWLMLLLQAHQRAEDRTIGPGFDWGKFISEGAAQGERDNRMTKYVGHQFRHGHAASEVLEAARVLNTAKVRPPLPDRDLVRIVKSIARAEARR